MTITINDKEIQLKYSFRAMMIYENIAQKSFEPKGITEFILLFYSMIMASDKDFEMSLEEFIDWLDEQPKVLEEYIKWLASRIDQNNYLSMKTDDGGDEEKKS